ncbi:MAG: hypothetical protein A2297_02435 [Elusimicrobia bacterium RIFOXYB2_FULL_48_7]|nr:MAG: hypothetical protein A2297_02435 [Elusimicrobia bacterium RIFOXYB2_FULL_48_7]
MSKLYYLLFFVIAFSIYFGMHYYIYSQVSGGLGMPRTAANWLKLLLLAAGLSFIAGEAAIRQSDAFIVKSIAFFGVIWFGLIGIAVSTFIIRHISLIFFHSPGFRYYSTLAALVVIGLTAVYSYINQAQPPQIRNIEIKTAKIPEKLSGFTVVQLSDLHLGPLKSVKLLKNIVDKANSLDPDLIVISGDLIDERCEKFDDTLKQLKARHGVFAVTGNHDYYAGLDNFLETAEAAGMRVLRNESKIIAGVIELAGINDIQSWRFEGSTRPDVKKILAGCDSDRNFVILLSHQPQVFGDAADAGSDLQLSGHTHAGQVPPMDLIVQFYYKYPQGLFKKGNSSIYTNPGTSYWGPPLRTFSHSEIAKITLKHS